MKRMKLLWTYLCLVIFCTPKIKLQSQTDVRPEIEVTVIEADIELDGALTDLVWEQAISNNQFRTIVPVEDGEPSNPTEIRVLANTKNLIIGIECFDQSPDQIVNFSKLRDSELNEEDHIRLVIDPFLDGQSGIIFAVNASGARYDALVSNRGESENEDWDAIWEAKTTIPRSGMDS